MLTSIKRQAKKLKSIGGFPLSRSQELVARSYGFTDYHDLRAVVRSGAEDPRLTGAALSPSSYPGTADGWEETLNRQATFLSAELDLPHSRALSWSIATHGFPMGTRIATIQSTYMSAEDFFAGFVDEIDLRLGDVMSGPIAETNAWAYAIDEYWVRKTIPDVNRGELTLDVNIQYSGDQDPDKPFCGSQFDLDARCLFKFSGTWYFEDIDVEGCTDNWV
ncbi:hypothetical protein [Thiolapillus sp.]|uniref:hypothetical protein n=1 Tax=Thiolapillus sp. TaxID=2017437 RepID=UPI003AF60693